MGFLKNSCCKYKSARTIFVLLLLVIGVGYLLYDRYLEADVAQRLSQTSGERGSLGRRETQLIRQASLHTERTDELKRDEQTARSEKVLSIVTANSDKYTQTEAFLSLPEMQKAVAK